jgi:hypothetical protein
MTIHVRTKRAPPVAEIHAPVLSISRSFICDPSPGKMNSTMSGNRTQPILYDRKSNKIMFDFLTFYAYDDGMSDSSEGQDGDDDEPGNHNVSCNEG